MQSRDLVKKVKKNCERCRYLRKRTVNIEMGPVLTHNSIIASAFCVTQVDLCGPFKTFPSHKKRRAIKTWLALY